MKNLPKVSAVIPHYGDASPTIELVNALKQQTYVGEIEIIVSDDNSPESFPHIGGVVVTRREKNGGFGSNVNSGVAEATGEWLMILNSDLELPATFVSDIMAVAQKYPRAVLSPQVIGHDGLGQYVARNFPSTFSHAWNWFTPLARFRDTQWWHRFAGHNTSAVTGKIVETDWVMGACMVMPLAAFQEVGGMDERFFMNSEEVDVQRRLKDAGYPAIFAGTVTITHEGGGSSEGTKRRQWLTESHFIYENKWSKKRTLEPALISITLLNFVFNLIRSVRNKTVHPLEIFKTEMTLIRNGKKKVHG